MHGQSNHIILIIIMNMRYAHPLLSGIKMVQRLQFISHTYYGVLIQPHQLQVHQKILMGLENIPIINARTSLISFNIR